MPSIEQDARWYAEAATSKLLGLDYKPGWGLDAAGDDLDTFVAVKEAFIAGYEHAKKEAAA